MFGLAEWQSGFYGELRAETKLAEVLRLLKLGLNVEQVAHALDVNIELVQQIAKAYLAD